MLTEAEKYLKLLDGQYYKCFGKIVKVVGLTIESVGPEARLNDMCMIYLNAERTEFVMAEVVGFRDSNLILMPFDSVEGVEVVSRDTHTAGDGRVGGEHTVHLVHHLVGLLL